MRDMNISISQSPTIGTVISIRASEAILYMLAKAIVSASELDPGSMVITNIGDSEVRIFHDEEARK